jgi:hypothetical protein
MKKLAVIGMVFVGLMLSTAGAWAAPTGMTKPEYRALMLRSEGLNQKYGAYRYSQPGLVSEKLAGLDLVPTATSTSGGGFDWNDAGIGIVLVSGFVVLGVGSLLTVRQGYKPIPH